MDGYLITADQNIVHSKATMDYRIDDPVGCVLGFAGRTNGFFNLSGTSIAIRDALDTAPMKPNRRRDWGLEKLSAMKLQNTLM